MSAAPPARACAPRAARPGAPGSRPPLGRRLLAGPLAALLLALGALGAGAADAQAGAAPEAAGAAPPPAALEACGDEGRPLRLEIRGLGVARFADLAQDAALGIATLSGDACVQGEGGWTLRADEIRVLGLREGEPRLDAGPVLLGLGSWTVVAEELEGGPGGLLLRGVRLSGDGVEAGAAAARLELGEGPLRAELEAVEAVGPGFIVAGASARLEGDALALDDALVSTCSCRGRAPVRLEGERVGVDLARGSVVVRDGVLVLGPARLPLRRDVEVDREGIEGILPPVEITYEGETPSGGRGAGLGVVAGPFSLGGERPGVTEEVVAGLYGIDVERPLVPLLLYRYRAPGLAVEAGRARNGLRLDLERSTEVADDLAFAAAFRVLDEPAADRLAEGGVRWTWAPEPAVTPAGERLRVTARAFGFASGQFEGDPVADLRAGLRADARLDGADGPIGRLSLAGRLEATRYLAAGAWQWGARLEPSWTLQRGPLRASARYRLQATNGASPFSAALDRLEPLHDASASVRIAGAPAPDAEASAALSASFDLREATRGWTSVALEAEAGIERGGVRMRPSVRLELAPLLAGASPEARDGRLRVAFDVEAGAVQAGASVEAGISRGGAVLDELEAYGAVPFALGPVGLRPFVAVDASPLLRTGEPPRISGHGLELAVATCCGVLQAGYRQRDNVFETRVGLALLGEPRPLW